MKKRIFLLLLAISISSSLCGCNYNAKSSNTATLAESLEGSDLIPIPGEDNLAYFKNGKTVYIVVNYYATYNNQSYSYMAPLIINGHNCEYHDGEIVEVIN